MTTYAAVRDPNRCPTHPGEVLEDIFEDIGKTKTQVAKDLDISRQHLYDIIGGKKPVSRDVAGSLGHYFGNGAGVWLRIQAAHDAWHADRAMKNSKAPVLEMPHAAAM